jgi:hypothetical protein
MNAMSDEQLDQALGQAMQRQSLQDIPATRTPPAPPWATEAGRTVTYVPAKSRRWLHAGIGVAAAAAVVTAVVLATGHNGSPAPGGTPTGSTVPTTPSSPTTDATGPTETPATTDAPQSGTATLGGATVALPTGWSAVHRPNILAGADTWCLGEGGNCRVTFHRYDVVGYGGPEPEVPTGTTVATSKYCGTDAPVGPVLIDSRTSTVGGREAEYRKWYAAGKGGGFELGAVQLVQVEPYIVVANMIGQQGIKTGSKGPPIRYPAVDQCLARVGEAARSAGASVHMPRIGCGLAGGKWEQIEPLIEAHLTGRGVEVTVYDFGK